MTTPAAPAVIPENLVWGPGDLYIGDFGAVEPLDTALDDLPDDAVWTYMGGTNGGVEFTADLKYDRMDVDQVTERVGSRLTQADYTWATNLAELTLENLANALNGPVVVTTADATAYEPRTGSSATQPVYRALLIDGWGPNSARRRTIARKVLQIEKVGTAFKKDGQTFFPVTFAGHYVSGTVKPFRVIDPPPPAEG